MLEPASRDVHRLVGVELIRFLSAITILVFHFTHFFEAQGEVSRATMPFYDVLGWAYEGGGLAVQVFWVVSGLIFFHNYADRIAGRNVSALRFAVLRVSRLYPLHFTTLLLVAGLQAVYFHQHDRFFVYQNNDLPHFVKHLFFASNWTTRAADSFNAPVWSVSVEVLIYAFFFAMMRVVGAGLFASVVLTVVLLLGSRTAGPVGMLSLCGFYFFLGGLTQHAMLAGASLRRRLPWVWNGGLALTIVGGVAGFSLVPRARVAAVIIVTLLPPVLLLSISLSQRLPASIERTLVALGDVTYASYLIHFPLQLAIVLTFTDASGMMSQMRQPWSLPAFILLTLCLSRLIFIWFERPAQYALRRAFDSLQGNR